MHDHRFICRRYGCVYAPPAEFVFLCIRILSYCHLTEQDLKLQRLIIEVPRFVAVPHHHSRFLKKGMSSRCCKVDRSGVAQNSLHIVLALLRSERQADMPAFIGSTNKSL